MKQIFLAMAIAVAVATAMLSAQAPSTSGAQLAPPDVAATTRRRGQDRIGLELSGDHTRHRIRTARANRRRDRPLRGLDRGRRAGRQFQKPRARSMFPLNRSLGGVA